jgi:transcriptional regulator with XRE-family HTH domain
MQDSPQSKLRYARSLTGLSQEKFAAALELSRSTIAQWEAEGDVKFKTSPSRDNLIAVARLAKIPLFFFENDDVPIPRDDAGIEIRDEIHLYGLWRQYKEQFGDKPSTASRPQQNRSATDNFLDAVRLEVLPEKPDLSTFGAYGIDVGGVMLKATYIDDEKVIYLLAYDWSGRSIKGFYETVGYLSVIGAYYPKLERYIAVYMRETDTETSAERDKNRKRLVAGMERIGIKLVTVTRPSELAKIILEEELPF